MFSISNIKVLKVSRARLGSHPGANPTTSKTYKYNTSVLIGYVDHFFKAEENVIVSKRTM
jgi:hypothetical protein